ncbi:hypothetical protein KIE16_04920 [Pseudomonas syringae]|uniref:hypothetical protein n=1 Tax=Pseudomonas syringae TaxID=317 RepID=UPI001BCDCDBB|nr:hypothetical protein [Pseudomonas syringae]MBS7422323.1 hypothetical protein [Pseudomonas syringae]
MTKHYVKTQPLTDSQISILSHGPTVSFYGDELQYMVKAGLMEMTLYGQKEFEREGFIGAGISRRFRPSARGIASLSLVAPERLPDAGLQAQVKTPPPKQEISCLALGLLLYSMEYSVMSSSMAARCQDGIYCAKHDLIRMGFVHDAVYNDLSYGSDVVEYTPEGAAIITGILQAASHDYGVDLAEIREALSVMFLATGGLQLDTNATFDLTAQQWKVLEHYNFATVTRSDAGRMLSLKIHPPLVISWFEDISKPYPYTTLGQFNLKITEAQRIYPDVIAQFTAHKTER